MAAPARATSALVGGMAVLLAVACAPLALIALWFGMRSTRPSPRDDRAAEPSSTPAAEPAPTASEEALAPAPVSSQRYWGSGWDATCGDRPAGFVPPGGL